MDLKESKMVGGINNLFVTFDQLEKRVFYLLHNQVNKIYI